LNKFSIRFTPAKVFVPSVGVERVCHFGIKRKSVLYFSGNFEGWKRKKCVSK